MLSRMMRKVRDGVAGRHIEHKEDEDVCEYQYKSFSILLPGHHKLPIYQREHKKYDRFLPHLATYLTTDDVVIDIGANVGDTLAGMAEKNASLRYICIEPDDDFFELLTKNIARIKAAKLDLRVQAIKSLVGNSTSGLSLEGKGGTKHAVVAAGGELESKPLDVILRQVENISNIRVLKSDVDGFDYDVINSSLVVIRANRPIIFFECQYENESQEAGFRKALTTLQSEGYGDWTLFDNFGEIMIRTSDLQVVEQLMAYVSSQNRADTTRTIYYYDILAVQHKDSDLIDIVLEKYR